MLLTAWLKIIVDWREVRGYSKKYILFISNIFISNAWLKLAKNWAKARQHLSLNFCCLKIIRFHHPRYHPKIMVDILKMYSNKCVCFNKINLKAHKLIKKRLQQRCFPVKYAKYSKATALVATPDNFRCIAAIHPQVANVFLRISRKFSEELATTLPVVIHCCFFFKSVKFFIDYFCYEHSLLKS